MNKIQRVENVRIGSTNADFVEVGGDEDANERTETRRVYSVVVGDHDDRAFAGDVIFAVNRHRSTIRDSEHGHTGEEEEEIFSVNADFG